MPIRGREWLGGAGLSATFFLPIAAGREVDDALFMWTARHSAELLCAWLLLALLFTGALVLTFRQRNPRREATVLLALGILSALSLTAVTGRTIRELYGARSLPVWAPVTGTIVLLAVAIAALIWAPRVVARGVRRLYACGALLLVPLLHFGLTVGQVGQVGRVSPDPPALSASPAPQAPSCRDVYVMLFDELSYTAVFSGTRPVLPNVQALAASATVYHHAMSPPPDPAGTDVNTLDAVASYLRGHGPPESVTEGPFGAARRAGFHIDVSGWYFPYCGALGPLVDRCHDHSLYNASAMSHHFDITAPFQTAINVWPYQLPTGILKRPVATWVHGRSLDALLSDATAPPPARPAFRWMHFNVPHSPFLQDAGVMEMGAFAPTRERYGKQVERADRVLGAVLESLTSRGELTTSTVVLLADHASRDGFADNPLHVPLIVHEPGGHRVDRTEPVNVADVLMTLAPGACSPPPS